MIHYVCIVGQVGFTEAERMWEGKSWAGLRCAECESRPEVYLRVDGKLLCAECAAKAWNEEREEREGIWTDGEAMSGMIGGIWWRRNQGSWHWFEHYSDFMCGIPICGSLRMTNTEKNRAQNWRPEDPGHDPNRGNLPSEKSPKCSRCVALLKKRTT